MLDMMQAWIQDGISEETFFGINVINEPLATSSEMKTLLKDDFYPRCYKLIRGKFGPDFKVTFSKVY